ncbi:MAG: MBOAT family protein [Bacteroidales bacterium]|nr:MBOAT family protein [Bacteroidales bacterium]MDD4216221.1 MBOAT family protein [Bacteroidales bacterium]MDY0141379.1 MBOAT family O-acyltransferase [Bacteroidales bacterium]
MMDYIKDILTYNQSSPLIFTRFFFWGFFAIVLLGYTFFANKRVSRSLYLLVLSLFFYYKSSGFFFFLIIFSTLVDYFIGWWIYNTEKSTARKLQLALSIFINLFVLSYFKYTFFFTGAINDMFGTNLVAHNYLAEFSNLFTGTSFDTAKIFLPVGISFFTFQTMSYTLDIYRRELKPVKNIIDFGFYVSFFPQLVAGPIVRAKDFIPQIYQKFKLSRYEFGLALFMILKGLIKKIMIGDYIAVNFVDRVFSNPDMYTGFESLMAMIGYSLQVYVDFSGYTDIAIGVALFMGFRLNQNFNSPYKAKNCGDFWSRWHISLSSWLKDYLYIPLGGNRNATKGTYLNIALILGVVMLLAANMWVSIGIMVAAIIVLLIMRFIPSAKKGIVRNINVMITMLFGGLWHGSSWNFLIWGGLNGLGVITYKYWRKISPWEKYNNRIATIWKITITFGFITFTRVFFRAPDYETATTMLNRIRTVFTPELIPNIISGYYKVWLMMLFGFITHWLSYAFKDKWRDKFINLPHWSQAIISAMVIFIVYQSICSDMVAFIYFQF